MCASAYLGYMEFWGSVIEFFDAKMTTPTNYGWFHLLSIALVIAATVFLCTKFKDSSDRSVRKLLFYVWVVMVLLEVYKQLNYALSYENGVISWDYAWYAFPYQFCSTPLFALPVIVFMKDGHVRDAFIAFMSFFSLFAGVAVFFYPNDVFISTVGVNIQTMFHHGMQIVLGIFLTVHNRRKLSLEYFARSVAVFGMFVAIAIIMNFAVYHALVGAGMDDTFNMFYISPYFDCTLPVLSDVYSDVSYPVFIVIYILGFAFVAFLMYLIQSGIAQLAKKGIGLHAHQH